MTETPPEQTTAGNPVGPLVQEAAMLLDVVADRLEAMKKDPASERVAAATSAAGSGTETPAAPNPAAAPDRDADAHGAGPTPDASNPTPGQGDATATAEPVAAAASDGRCPECGATPGGYCTACPLCRFMALLRGERPEATARLVDGALMIIRTLRSMVPEPGEPAAAAHQHSHGHAASEQPARAAAHPHTTPPARRTGLEHINIL